MQDVEDVKICDYYLDSVGNKIEIMPDNTLELNNLSRII